MRPRRLHNLLLGLGCLLISGTAAGEGLPEPFVLYREGGAEAAPPYTPSGWMGDWGDIVLDAASTEQPHSGTTCLKIIYSAQRAQKQGWAGVFWQRPANNWGDKDAGLDLTGARHLAFWARGARGGEVIEKFQVGGIKGKFPDTCEVLIGPIRLTTEWQEYLIPLDGKDLTRLIGAFMWATSKASNPQGCTFYLDDIRFE